MTEFSLFDIATTKSTAAALYNPCVYNPECNPYWW
jgi:hypothetical protein